MEDVNLKYNFLTWKHAKNVEFEENKNIHKTLFLFVPKKSKEG